MCGFAGYKTFAKRSVDHTILHSISELISHRGPDDEGTWISPNNDCAFVSRRLSIIDTSQNGSQPMTNQDQSIVLVFNGEIYNYKSLRKELSALGHQFRSESDTEVVLCAYKQWGIECLSRLDGMFACAFYDRAQGSIYLARDRMGIKPLYFSLQGDALCFSSEIKALWQFPWMVRRMAMRAVSHYLTYLATPAPMTLFEGVYKLPAGFYATIDAHGSFSATQWYDPLLQSTEESRERFQKKSHCVSAVRSLLNDAVQKRLMADVPVGALLSGGLDSSLIVALMAQHHERVNTFTVSFDQDPQEERSWARKIAKKFRTDHHELILTEQDAFSFFEKMVHHQDEPLGDAVCVPLYYVSTLARDAGVKVVLAGEGADELFCGYPMYVDYLNICKYWQLSQHYVPKLAKKGLYYAARPFYADYPNRQDMLKSWSDGRPLFWGGVRVFSELWKKDFVHGAMESDHDPIIDAIYKGFPQGADSYAIADYHRQVSNKKAPWADFFASMTYIELKHRLPELLLTRTDKMSMAASIEARVPFMDHALVEAVLQMPMRFKYRDNQTKYVLKKAAEGLVPHENIYRKKVGFSSPVTHWFKQGDYFKAHLRDMIQSDTKWRDCFDTAALDELITKNQTSKMDYSYQLWALHNLMAF